jgi:glycerophosphoryl diester phosphodiesterase
MRPVLEGAPIAAAHRGSRLLWPENTMPAFQGAIDLGFSWIETDLHLTADGVLMTFHDDTLERCTDRAERLEHCTLSDLDEVNAGYRFEIDGHHPYRAERVAIPTLEELVVTFPSTRFIVDMKAPGLEQPLADFIEKYRVEERVIVGGFSDRRIKTFRRITNGRVATSSGPFETIKVRAKSWVGMAATTTADAFQVPVKMGIRVVDAAFIRSAHRAKKQVHVWTINDRGEMDRLLDLGVDGLITDRPDTLAEVFADRGLKL